MLSRPLCPEQGLPTDLDDCVYHCFEIHRHRVLQRRARRKAKKQQQYQQSLHTEQYQNSPPQPSIPSSYYPNIIQDSSRYQTLFEPTKITYRDLNIDQSNTLPITTHYQSQIIDTPEPYHQLKEARYTSEKVIPTYTNIIEQPQVSAQFQQSQDIYIQPAERITYINQYQPPISQVYDSHITNQQIISSSIPTGTVEYTRKAYFSQEPISDQSNTISHTQQIQSSDNQQHIDDNFPPATVQTYDQNIYTNEQIVPTQPSLPLYEENQQTIVNEPVPSSAISDNGSDDAGEDQEMLDLRACICLCLAKCKYQQARYQQQFHDIQQPIPQPCYQQIQQVHQPIVYNPVIPPPIPVLQPPVQIVPPVMEQYIPPPQIDQPLPPRIATYLPPVIEKYIPPPQIDQPLPPRIATYLPPVIEQYIPPPQIDQPLPPRIATYLPPVVEQYIPPPQIDQRLPPRIDTYLPPVVSLPPPPPPPPQPAVAQAQRWCVRCCCVPGQSLIKKNIYRQIEEEQQHEEEYIDYASVMDQLETKITVRYGNRIMEEGETFVSGNYNEQLRIIDFPVYISGENGIDMVRLVPDT